MPYDLLIKNGRVIDGSGNPAFAGDLGIRNGKIVEIGKLRGAAARTLDAGGLVVAPGFIDTHCHYDAQVTWDPLCSFSCYHGATTVIIGNCSLALAPVRPDAKNRLAEFLSYVEAIPMETLQTVDMNWETIPEYMAAIEKRLGINVGNLIGHTAVRHYVMGDESQSRAATRTEIEAMRDAVRDGMGAGALGLSFNKNEGHYDPQGVKIPSLWAEEEELFALGDVLAELGTGVIQAGGGSDAEERTRLMTRLSEATGRQVIYNRLTQRAKQPEAWKKQLALLEESVKAGIRANPQSNTVLQTSRFTMRNAQQFKGIPTWHPILLMTDEEKLRAYRDPEVRRKLHQEVIEWSTNITNRHLALGPGWYDYYRVYKTVLPKNQIYQGKTLRYLAESQGKGIIDAFLDLAVEENLDTVFQRESQKNDVEVNATILNSPHVYIGQSDGGAHVQFQSAYGFSTRFLGYWVRERGIMPLEQGVKRLTFDSASVFGIYDRGLLRPGLAADITIFDPETINPLPEDVVHDLPAGAWRTRELATGVHYTIVNGQVLLDEGRHTGALPGQLLRNSRYRENAGR